MDGVHLAVLGLLLAGCVLSLWRWVRYQATSCGPTRSARRPRVLHPQTPEDCPCCRAEGAGQRRRGPDRPPVRPWREGTQWRGRPRRISTEGSACPTPMCAYYGITESSIHALVGDGHHGKCAPIQNFRCQACGTKVSALRHAALSPAHAGRSGWGGPQCAGRGAGCGRRGARVRAWRNDHHALARSRWTTRGAPA